VPGARAAPVAWWAGMRARSRATQGSARRTGPRELHAHTRVGCTRMDRVGRRQPGIRAPPRRSGTHGLAATRVRGFPPPFDERRREGPWRRGLLRGAYASTRSGKLARTKAVIPDDTRQGRTGDYADRPVSIALARSAYFPVSIASARSAYRSPGQPITVPVRLSRRVPGGVPVRTFARAAAPGRALRGESR
jgi:hypothetical protein